MEQLEIMTVYFQLFDLISSAQYDEFLIALVEHYKILTLPENNVVLMSLQDTLHLYIEIKPSAHKFFIEDLGYNYNLLEFLHKLRAKSKVVAFMLIFLRKYI